MKTIQFAVCEVLDSSDAEQVIEDIGNSGGTTKNYEINEDDECGFFTVTVEDTKAFMAKFRETDSGCFM